MDGEPVSVSGWTTWKRAIEMPQGDDRHCDALIAYLRDTGVRFGGFVHQSETIEGAPIFSDGCACAVSMRVWGGIVAEAVGDGPVESMAYCRWAWVRENEPGTVLPDGGSVPGEADPPRRVRRAKKSIDRKDRARRERMAAELLPLVNCGMTAQDAVRHMVNSGRWSKADAVFMGVPM